MFFELARKNSRQNRRGNGFYFASLVIAVVAFYIVLSLDSQDVIRFLRTIEREALKKLMLLIPVLYMISLAMLFFLIYFTDKYQMGKRAHEFGVYLTLGMRRGRLFGLLFLENLWNSLAVFAAGISLGVLLSELISLVTARVFGFGVIGHRFAFSWKAVLFAAAGFFFIKGLTTFLLCGKMMRGEIYALLEDRQEEKQHTRNIRISILYLAVGILLLAVAYFTGINGMAWNSRMVFLAVIAGGCAGTFLTVKGCGAFFELLLRRKEGAALGMFTFRQLQENVFLKSGILAVSSLLLLMSWMSFGYGIAMSGSMESEERGIDFTFSGEEEQIREVLKQSGVEDETEGLFAVRNGLLLTSEDESAMDHGLRSEAVQADFSEFRETLERLEDADDQEMAEQLLMEYQYSFTSPYLIGLSGYNEILKAKGEEPLVLNSDQAVLYRDPQFINDEQKGLIEEALQEDVALQIEGKPIHLLDRVYADSLVADQAVTISIGMIVPDEVFDRLIKDRGFVYWNAVLKADIVSEKGMMNAEYEASERLKEAADGTEVTFESYLTNAGRHLFYVIAVGYTTIYIGIIFLIIANTMIGVQFLMHQEKTGARYRILLTLGSDIRSLCRSARTQICWYYGIPAVMAAVSSIFGIQTLFSLGVGGDGDRSRIIFSGIVLLCFCVGEAVYIRIVMRISDRRIRKFVRKKRQE